jgi:hypothetical protein
VPLGQELVVRSSPSMDRRHIQSVAQVAEAAAGAIASAVGSNFGNWREACTDQYYMQQSDPGSPAIAELETSLVVGRRVLRRRRSAKGPFWWIWN